MKSRNLEIDTLRGFAIIFLAAYHVIGSTTTSGLKLSDGYIREINDFLIYFRMPLFTFLSGYVYAYRPFQSGALKFLKGKARRLIIPMLVVGTSFAIIQSIIPGTNSGVQNWYLIHIIPYAHFWFIESLFVIFIIIVPLEYFGILKNKIPAAAILFLASILYISNFQLSWFSISGAIYLMPYFIIGMSISRFSLAKNIKIYWGWILIFAVLIFLTVMNISPNTEEKRTLFALIIGLSSCTAFLLIRMKITWLSIIGTYSYSIYLYHVFFTAGSRIFLTKFGIENIALLFSIGLILGIIGPIFVELIFDRYSFTRLFFLGKRRLGSVREPRVSQ